MRIVPVTGNHKGMNQWRFANVDSRPSLLGQAKVDCGKCCTVKKAGTLNVCNELNNNVFIMLYVYLISILILLCMYEYRIIFQKLKTLLKKQRERNQSLAMFIKKYPPYTPHLARPLRCQRAALWNGRPPAAKLHGNTYGWSRPSKDTNRCHKKKQGNYLCISKISWDAKVPVRLTCFVWEMVLIEIVCFSTSDFWAPPLTRPRTDFRSAPGSKESLGFGSDNSDVELTSSRNKQAQRAVGIRRSHNVDKLHDLPGWFSLQFTSFHMISYGKTLPSASDFPKTIMTLRELT